MTLVKPTQGGLEVPLRRFTYREMLEMARTGILGEDERVELLHGSIIAMTPVNPPHAWAVSELHNHLLLSLQAKAVVVSQNPLRLSANLDDDKLPLPDVMVLAKRVYSDHPLPEDVWLLVEVADSTLAKDRQVKGPLYAEAGISEFWIVNLVDKRIEVYTDPQGADYLTRRSYGLTQPLAPRRFPDEARPWLTEDLLKLLA